jgi:hypothetical protein
MWSAFATCPGDYELPSHTGNATNEGSLDFYCCCVARTRPDFCSCTGKFYNHFICSVSGNRRCEHHEECYAPRDEVAPYGEHEPVLCRNVTGSNAAKASRRTGATDDQAAQWRRSKNKRNGTVIELPNGGKQRWPRLNKWREERAGRQAPRSLAASTAPPLRTEDVHP